MRLPVDRFLPLAALTLLTACAGGVAGVQDLGATPQAPYGPAGDYPVVVGPPYGIGGVTYTPVDTMNYDVVGRASLGQDGGSDITAAHHTLPLPSYVEVTALDSGRTVLVRVERRGPMSGNNVIELSPGAAAQLGFAGTVMAPVRVRRVNPIEPERALLRAGQFAPPRMDTPKSLLSVLQRKLDQQEGVVRPAPDAATSPAVAAPNPTATALPKQAATPAATAAPKPASPAPKPKPAAQPKPKPAPTPPPAAAPSPAPKPAIQQPAAKGRFFVQVAAFSSQANAKAAATKVGGSVIPAGKLWRVRIGPFSTNAEARAALAKAHSAGYADARIQSAD